MDALLDSCGRRRVTLLLFLHLFVVKAAADCLKPEVQGNIVLTNEALLMNNFPEGVHVTLECANGYVLESGSGNITCIDKNWTIPDLTCKKMDCGPPRPQNNMSFNISAGTLFGAVAKVVCDKGFKVVGVSYKQCFKSGWIGRAKCEIATCHKPAQVTNGRSSWDSQDKPKYGEIIHYECNVGYALVGESRVMCNESGLYNSQPPTCEKMAPPSSSTPGARQEVSTSSELPATATTSIAIKPPIATIVPTRLTAPITSTSPTAPITPITPTAPTAPITPTARTAVRVTTRATPTAPPSLRGGGDISTAAGKATTTSETSMASSSLPGQHFGTVDTNKDIGYMPVIVSVTCVSLVACIVAIFLHKFLLKRKGSVNGTEPIY